MDRRTFLTGGAIGTASAVGGVLLGRELTGASEELAAFPASSSIDFRGARQAGIDTPHQRHAVFSAFDIAVREQDVVAALMADWTSTAESLSQGGVIGEDTGEATDMGPARLTVTFGFGASLFDDLCAPRAGRPAGLVELPEFVGDQLEPEWGGGDILVQVCADDPTVVSHAVRQLRRVARGRATVRWAQAGFLPQAEGQTARNLFGQVDGTANPTPGTAGLDELVWVTDGPTWMVGGSYLATRRIRMMLTMWDRMDLGVQEATVGRYRDSGAPLSGGDEFTAPNLEAEANGTLVIPPDAHVRIAKTEGPGMLRRGFSFDNGPRFPAGVESVVLPGEMDHSEHGQMDHSTMSAAMDDQDAGLFFAAFVRHPRDQFIVMQQALSAGDGLGHFLAYTSADLWAVPRGAESGAIGAELFT